MGSRFPFSLSTEVHKCLAPSNWWTSLAASVRQYLMDFKLISGLKPDSDFPPTQFLTHFALSHLSNNEIVLFNWARIYFWCCTLQDLYFPSTATIHPQFLVRPPRNLAKTSKPWPITNPPSTPAFQVWRHILQLVSRQQFAYLQLRIHSRFFCIKPTTKSGASNSSFRWEALTGDWFWGGGYSDQ